MIKKKQVRITREEVARRAGVSKSTVTNVLSAKQTVPIHPDTRTRVLEAARELGYHPSFAARSLVQQSTHIVGLLVPSGEAQSGAYYARMIAGLLLSTQETPYNFLYMSQENPGKYGQCLAQGYLDAAVILQTHCDDAHAAAVARSGLPAVTMNYLNDSGLPQISADYEGAMDQAYELLIGEGARSIAFVCGEWGRQPNRRILKRHGLLAARLGNRAELRQFSTVKEALKRIDRGERPDALVVDGLPVGMEAHRGLLALGLRPGADMGLTVFNTEDPAAEAPEGMTVYDAQPEAVGKETWRVLERLLGCEEVPRTTLVPFLPHGNPGMD